MTAYMIISVTPDDHDKMHEYEQKTLEIVSRYAGRPVTRDVDVVGIDTDDVPAIGVILELPDKQAVQDFYSCDEYAPLKAFRKSFARASALVFEVP